ncbi:MAG: hypothetical protein KA143_00455 [Saprospiraceae bacterium]|nr:hypothetical protein [Saprospiraceae bacterium]
MIILNCDGGLCNRMRAIDAAIEYSQLASQELSVIWRKNRGLNCDYGQLFEANPLFEIIHHRWYHYTGQPRHLRNPLRKWIGITLEKSLYDATFYENDRYRPDILQVDPVSLKGIKKIYITNSNNFLKTRRSYAAFRPVGDLRSKIDTIGRAFPKDIVGVHVRRTDHEQSIRYSTDSTFFSKMKELKDQNPGLNFFLATDDPFTDDKFKFIWGESILTYPKVFGRNSEQGIQDAVIDLYLLSKTKGILASYYSSFSEAAADIGNIPLEIVK